VNGADLDLAAASWLVLVFNLVLAFIAVAIQEKIGRATGQSASG
jgi:hypothetical protein